MRYRSFLRIENICYAKLRSRELDMNNGCSSIWMLLFWLWESTLISASQ